MSKAIISASAKDCNLQVIDEEMLFIFKAGFRGDVYKQRTSENSFRS
jgi:hypothetical protein